MKTFKIELDDYDVHTLTYTMQHADKNDEYLQRAIENTLEKLVNQIKEQMIDQQNFKKKNHSNEN